MSFIAPHTKKRFKETNKNPEVETITNKKYWVVVDNKNNLVYHRDGHLLIFANKRIAIEWFHDNDRKCKNTTWRLERLNLCITRE
jgi:uncharacterized pyridoxamine 5'-phosphate oxidase family protein